MDIVPVNDPKARLVLQIRPKTRNLVLCVVYLLAGLAATAYFLSDFYYRVAGLVLSVIVAVSNYDETETTEFNKPANDLNVRRSRFGRTTAIVRTILDEVNNVDVEETNLRFGKFGYRLRLKCRGYAVPLSEAYLVGAENKKELEKQADLIRTFLGQEFDETAAAAEDVAASGSDAPASTSQSKGFKIIDSKQRSGTDEKEMLVEMNLDELRKRSTQKSKKST